MRELSISESQTVAAGGVASAAAEWGLAIAVTAGVFAFAVGVSIAMVSYASSHYNIKW